MSGKQTPYRRRKATKPARKPVPPKPAQDAASVRSSRINPSPELEKCIARILLLRWHQDICRLFSMHLHNVCDEVLPGIIYECVRLSGPGWVANNAGGEVFKQYFRSVIAMDLRECGDRVASTSLRWSYMSIRQFALARDIHVCKKRGVHSHHLIPHLAELEDQRCALESMTPPRFVKPPHARPLTSGWDSLEDDLGKAYSRMRPGSKSSSSWTGWKKKVRLGYDLLVDSVWEVANEFHVGGYGLVLKRKFEELWCDCGCSTDHLSEVCEPSVLKEEERAGKKSGKGREWDGRGYWVEGWNTETEEDLWDYELVEEADPTLKETESAADIENGKEPSYIRAEREKEAGNACFKRSDFPGAIRHYGSAIILEPELPHYQLNLAAAHLKLSQWPEAELACNAALQQHRSGKGYWRRAKARKELGRLQEAILDLQEIMTLQPENAEAKVELKTLLMLSSRADDSGSSGEGCSPSSSRVGYYDGVRDAAGHSKSTPNEYFPPRQVKKMPFVLHDMDWMRLKIESHPMTVQSDDDGKTETFSYPTWNRCGTFLTIAASKGANKCLVHRSYLVQKL